MTKEREAETKFPIQLTKGERVKCGEISDDNGDWAGWIYCTGDDKEGWVPRNIIEMDAADGTDEGIILEDYDATEFDLIIGDRIVSEKTLNGWVYGYKNGDLTVKAWAPLNHLNDVTHESSRFKKGSSYNKRPGFLTAIAVLNIVASLSIIILLITGFKSGRLQLMVGKPELIVNIASTTVMVSSMLAAGVGILIGKRWGWFIGIFSYVFGVLQHLLTIVMAIVYYSDGHSLSMGKIISEFSGRVVIRGLIILYFFSQGVLSYFGIEPCKKKEYLLKLIGAAAFVIVLREVLGYFVA